MTKADVRSAKSAQEKPEVVFGEGDLVRVTVVSGRPVRRVTKVDLGGLAIYVQGLCGSYSWSVLELVERAKKPD